MAEQYEAVAEDEWKALATTEITHLTDEEKDYLPRAWDEWLARVKRDAAREALDGYADALNRNRSAAVWDWPDFVGDVREWASYNYPETEDQK